MVKKTKPVKKKKIQDDPYLIEDKTDINDIKVGKKTVKLPVEVVQKIQINFANMKIANIELQKLESDSKCHDLQKAILNNQLTAKRTYLNKIQKEHKEYLEKVGTKYEVDLLNKSINPETYEVYDN